MNRELGNIGFCAICFSSTVCTGTYEKASQSDPHCLGLPVESLLPLPNQKGIIDAASNFYIMIAEIPHSACCLYMLGFLQRICSCSLKVLNLLAVSSHFYLVFPPHGSYAVFIPCISCLLYFLPNNLLFISCFSYAALTMLSGTR